MASWNEPVVNSADISSPGLDCLTAMTSGESSSQPEEKPNLHVSLSANSLSFIQNMDEKEGTYMWPIQQMILLMNQDPSWMDCADLIDCLQRKFEIHHLTFPSPTPKPSSDREDDFIRPTQNRKLHKSHVVSSAFLFISTPMALWGTLLWLFFPVDASKMAAGGSL